MSSGSVLVVGYGVTGRSVARQLRRRGCDPTVIDDRPTDLLVEQATADDIELVAAPDAGQLAALLDRVDYLAPSPGIPDAHPVFALAGERGIQTISEFDLARHWDDRPIVAVTGTDGKTTVTSLIGEMLAASEQRVAVAGNTNVPLIDAIDDPTVDRFVVEASSYRLGHSRRFEPAVAVWLNFAPDHLDVHASLDAYEAAKAKIWRDLGDGVAVVNLDDPVVARNRPAAGRVVTFGLGGDVHVGDGVLWADGEAILAVEELWRSLPHDLSNACAATAAALAADGSLDGIRQALRDHRGLAHRVELIAEIAGVRWFDDSKATTPHAAVSAMRGFDSVVLIAGGQNKGLDLGEMAAEVDRVRCVVAIGASADEIAAAFEGRTEVRRAASMSAAVTEAAGAALPGDAVLLSPGCASFDWYPNYGVRGDDFAAIVRSLEAETP